MKACVTSIGEVTTDLCVWSLERNGFEVVLYQDNSSLCDKLKRIYNDMDEDFVRIDADVVPNRNLTPADIQVIPLLPHWWTQFRCFGWFSQDVVYGGIQFIKKEALPDLRANVDQFMEHERPETQLSRIKEFYEPRRFVSNERVMGIHGFAAKDVDRVKSVKARRNQEANYDWELSERLLKLV